MGWYNIYMKPIVKECIQLIDKGKCPMVSFLCFESTNCLTAQTTGIIPLPEPDEDIVGGHAVCITEYSTANQWFKFKNSYGVGWGDSGYGYLPFKYFECGYVKEIYYIP